MFVGNPKKKNVCSPEAANIRSFEIPHKGGIFIKLYPIKKRTPIKQMFVDFAKVVPTTPVIFLTKNSQGTADAPVVSRKRTNVLSQMPGRLVNYLHEIKNQI